MSYPAILIPDHFEVGLVRSNSGLTGKTRQIIDLNGGHIQSHHQMRGAGGIAKVNDLGLMSLIGIEKTLLLRGVITEADDNHNRENSARIDTAIIRSLGANIVNAGPIVEAIQNLPSVYIEQLTPDQQINIPKIFDQLNTILNLNAVSIFPHAEITIAKQIGEIIIDLLNTITETFPSFTPEFQNIFLSVLKIVEPITIQHNLPVEIQNSIALLEENIIQFVESKANNPIKFDNDNVSVAIPSEVVDLKISEHDPKNEILDQDTAQQDIISDAHNDQDPDTVITSDTINDINIVDTDIDLESKPELQDTATDNVEEIILLDQEIVQIDSTIEPVFDTSKTENDLLDLDNENALFLSKGIDPDLGTSIEPLLSDQKNIDIENNSTEVSKLTLIDSNTHSMYSDLIPISVSQDTNIPPSIFTALSTPTINPETSGTVQSVSVSVDLTSASPAEIILSKQNLSAISNHTESKPQLINLNNYSSLPSLPIASKISIAMSRPILLPQYTTLISKILPAVSIAHKIPTSNIKPLFVTTAPAKVSQVFAPLSRVTISREQNIASSQNLVMRKPIVGSAVAKPQVIVAKQPQSSNLIPARQPKHFISTLPIQGRIEAIPKSLNRAQAIIQSILKSETQRNIIIQGKPANNNKPAEINIPRTHQYLAATPSSAHQSKPPIPTTVALFKDASKIAISSIKAKADDFYLQIKRNPAVQAACAISGGICRCSEQFNKAVRGLINDPVKKLLNEKNISEIEYINDARAQVKISKSIEALSSSHEQQINKKDDERLLNSHKNRDTLKKSNENAHIHGPWCEHASPPERARIAAAILPSQQISNESSPNTETKTLTARELRALAKNQSQLNVK